MTQTLFGIRPHLWEQQPTNELIECDIGRRGDSDVATFGDLVGRHEPVEKRIGLIDIPRFRMRPAHGPAIIGFRTRGSTHALRMPVGIA
jgi:hypothetical protein